MFERTFSFWRHLLGRGQAPAPIDGGGAAVEEDRRLWVRYQADLETRVQLAQGRDEDRVSARVRDVSIGGANLVTDQVFQPGQILSLELPAAADDDLQIVLACVVRVAKQGDGQWSLGCVFARELSSEDLERFGAGKTKPAGDDQRTWVRYDIAVTASYQRIGDADGETYTAQVLNLSASGVGLLLNDPIEPGCLINLTLHGKHGAPVRTILACIVHSTLRAGGELAVGCNFIRELGEDELQALL
jgi:c-di-GMP-binding flagellar brake protein YcgR